MTAVVIAPLLAALAVGWLWRRARRTTASKVAPEPPAAQAPARQIGAYRIERTIGRGAAGTVYLGCDAAGRSAAIKTFALRHEFDDEAYAEARERFFREAATARRLDHPDIVRVFDAGESGALAYIAMEFVGGADLEAHTRPGALLPAREAVEIAARIADALAHAHAQGVVHRDVKPANVLVDRAHGIVKVTDFGLAQVIDGGRTRTGLMLGSPSFMAPEQLAGARLDGRTDLYALGVLLFQLLAGTLPHASASMADLMRRIANEPAPDVRSLRPELPAPLAETLARALQKDPKARHADGAEMARALRAAVLLLPVGSGAAPASDPRPR
ncbi:MAG: serine/threonine protein kinase [Proteobacteria bacterium]|nr:serine/threonine protein kinase [Pseudomonadota bacterium]